VTTSALQRGLTTLGTMTARPWAFLVVLAYAVFWLAFERETFDLHAAATLIVWVMTLLIQRGGASGHPGHPRPARRAAASRQGGAERAGEDRRGGA